MKLFEAILSGRLFKRSTDPEYFDAYEMSVRQTGNPSVVRRINNRDLMANDWEIEEPTRELKRSDVSKAIETIKERGGSIDELLGELKF